MANRYCFDFGSYTPGRVREPVRTPVNTSILFSPPGENKMQANLSISAILKLLISF